MQSNLHGLSVKDGIYRLDGSILLPPSQRCDWDIYRRTQIPTFMLEPAFRGEHPRPYRRPHWNSMCRSEAAFAVLLKLTTFETVLRQYEKFAREVMPNEWQNISMCFQWDDPECCPCHDDDWAAHAHRRTHYCTECGFKFCEPCLIGGICPSCRPSMAGLIEGGF
jgi:hypothetical protein